MSKCDNCNFQRQMGNGQLCSKHLDEWLANGVSRPNKPPMPTKQSDELAAGQVLYAYGHSETRLVHYVSEFDGSYCYTELEEGYNDLHTLRVARAWDIDFDEWHQLAQSEGRKGYIDGQLGK